MPKEKSSDPRREARMAALQALFAADIKGDRDESSLEWLRLENALREVSIEFADALVRGVSDSRSELDEHIQTHAPAWPVDQLSLVDRNILRIALYELLHSPEVPQKTAINEAVELAKVFGSDSSARFINGVLGSVMDELETREIATDKAAPEGR
jgi:N utilization substance protein B